jgi:hypothetical protein
MPVLKNIFFNSTIITLLSVLFFSCSAPQKRGDHRMHRFNAFLEKFYTDPVVFFDTDSNKARLDLFIEIPYGNINYKKNPNTGKFDYNILKNINIKNSGDSIIISETYGDSISYSNEEMTKKSGEPQYYFYYYFLEPGNYKIDIKIKDNNSKDEFKKSIDLTVKDFKLQDVTFSNLMILSKYKANGDGIKEITPLINNNIFGLKEFFVFFEIYNNINTELEKEFSYKIKDGKDITIKEGQLKYTLSPSKNQKVENIKIAKEIKDYMPEDQDFDFFLFDDENNKYFKIEIYEKSSNFAIASKDLNFFPTKYNIDIRNKPPMR